MNNKSHLVEMMERLALEAGSAIMDIYNSGFSVDRKTDDSPVTEADRIGERIILDGLRDAAPSIPVLAEEEASAGNIPTLGRSFFLVDPLDGTKEFINKTGEFTVNIALVEDNRPVAGVVYAPAIETLYSGVVGNSAWIKTGPDYQSPRAVKAASMPSDGLVAVASRSHRSPETDTFLESLTVKEFTAAGSSLKFCLLADGRAHVYPRLGRTMEWDTGAGQAVLEAAGGSVCVFGSDEPLTYGKAERGFDNPHFVAWSKR